MKVICKNNPEHKEFYTTAHIMQEWKVDAEGNFIEVTQDCLEVVHPPMAGNTWVCVACESSDYESGSEVEVT